ncbi:MAG TPA: hypothetical protein VF670_14730, partial [Duganella sp.]
LKPEEKTRPLVQYRGLGGVVPRAMERKVPKGRSHDPFSYEVETWDQLKSEFSHSAQRAGHPAKTRGE